MSEPLAMGEFVLMGMAVRVVPRRCWLLVLFLAPCV